MDEQIARMGEWVVSREGGVLACIGLGSCIGLALVDRFTGVAGLAHVMLPEAPRADVEQPGKYADRAVPALVEALLELGAGRTRLEAALVGGAQMFAFGSVGGHDIGARNEEAVRGHLEAVRIPVRAAATGGDRGRSMKVYASDGYVFCRESAGESVDLLGAPAVGAMA
jgi:chemotaxis protein CheD